MIAERNVWVRQGEWIVRADPATGEPYADDGQNTGNHIARLSLTTMSDGTTMLNEGHGDLLAAAPDMRGALLSVLADAGTCISPSIMNVCQEALNKANGNVGVIPC